MSFSAEVKEELAEMVPSEFSLFTAELQGLLLYGAKLTEKEGGTELRFLSEHEESAKKYFTFIRKTDRIKTYERKKQNLHCLSLPGGHRRAP